MTERIDDVIKEMKENINNGLLLLHHLHALKERGVLYVDEDMEPVISDNVLFFPANRTVN